MPTRLTKRPWLGWNANIPVGRFEADGSPNGRRMVYFIDGKAKGCLEGKGLKEMLRHGFQFDFFLCPAAAYVQSI